MKFKLAQQLIKYSCNEFHENAANSLVTDARSQMDGQRRCSLHVKYFFLLCKEHLHTDSATTLLEWIYTIRCSEKSGIHLQAKEASDT
jgi:hypothetical protein